MKSNRVPLIIFIIIILSFALFNKAIMPVRKELTELELIKVIGMDSINEGKYKAEQTIVRIKKETTSSGSSSTSSSGGSNDSSSSKEVANSISIKGATFSDVIRSFQTYLNKSITGSHIKFILLGESFCKNDIGVGIDFNARDYEVRLSANVYITKGISSKEFIESVTNDQYELDEKITSMEKNNEAKNVSYETGIIDLLSILSKKNSCGLVPTLEIIWKKGDQGAIKENDESNDIQDFQNASVEKTKNSETLFDFGGYAIIKDKKLLAYLSREESITCNILKNRMGGTNINIDMGDKGVVSFELLNANTGYDFKFENKKLSEVIINTEIKTNFAEVATAENIFEIDKIEELEDKQSQQIKKEIEKVIAKVKEYKCDFLGFSEYAKVKHPYKYTDIKDEWSEQLVNAKFTINVKLKSLRTYDLLTLNK